MKCEGMNVEQGVAMIELEHKRTGKTQGGPH